jgi:hypothetical protein
MSNTFMQRIGALLDRIKSKERRTSCSRKDKRTPAGYFSILTNGCRQEELRFERLERPSIPAYRPHPDQSSWLRFHLYEQADGETFIALYDQTTSIDTGDLVRGVLLLVGPMFLSEKTQLQNKTLPLLPGLGLLPVALTDQQRKDLSSTFDKIESLMGGDYRFRKEYIQELVMQLIHFQLKSSGLFQLQQKPTNR